MLSDLLHVLVGFALAAAFWGSVELRLWILRRRRRMQMLSGWECFIEKSVGPAADIPDRVEIEIPLEQRPIFRAEIRDA